MAAPAVIKTGCKAMAPRKAAAKSSGSSKEKKGPASEAGAAEEEVETKSELPSPASSAGRRKAQQNMVNQLKSAQARVDSGKVLPGDEEKVAIYTRYRALGKFDDEKELLLNMWSKDKSCGWWKTYEESRGSNYKESTDGLSGYGSRYIHNLFMFAVLLLSYLRCQC